MYVCNLYLSLDTRGGENEIASDSLRPSRQWQYGPLAIRVSTRTACASLAFVRKLRRGVTESDLAWHEHGHGAGVYVSDNNEDVCMYVCVLVLQFPSWQTSKSL